MWTWWRLPTIAELRTLYRANWNNTLGLTYNYRSNTENINIRFSYYTARTLYMGNGTVFGDYTKYSNNFYVVCVHD
jgi:hypothetical protein